MKNEESLNQLIQSVERLLDFMKKEKLRENIEGALSLLKTYLDKLDYYIELLKNIDLCVEENRYGEERLINELSEMSLSRDDIYDAFNWVLFRLSPLKAFLDSYEKEKWEKQIEEMDGYFCDTVYFVLVAARDTVKEGSADQRARIIEKMKEIKKSRILKQYLETMQAQRDDMQYVYEQCFCLPAEILDREDMV